MKRNLLISLALCIGFSAFAQQRAVVPEQLRDLRVKKAPVVAENANPISKPVNNYVKAPLSNMEDVIGHTVYDLQSNGASPFGRVTEFSDGTFAAVWTRGMSATAYADRGSGYNYFDGTSWGTIDPNIIETVRTGWPSHAQFGANGEVVVSHRSATLGLRLSKRETKGTGPWTELDIPAPAGASGILWSRMVTGGIDKTTIHIIVLTGPVANGGTIYNGQDGALVYLRSQDGGVTWDKNEVLPGLGADFYPNISADTYNFAEPRGNTVAFSVTDESNDLIVMKSTDNGDTWQKTVVWEHPDNAANGNDSLWSQDGTGQPVIDVNGMVHLVFGVYETQPISATWSPGSGGVAYWNEDMPTWTGGTPARQINCLNPDSLEVTGNLIGYLLDLNGNGVYDGTGSVGLYYCAQVSMPQLVLDDNGFGWVVMSGLADGFNNGSQDYRHLFARSVSGFGASFGDWWDLNDDPSHMFDECVFPSICSKGGSPAGYHVIYQNDNEPGLSIRGDADPPGDNYINFMYLPFNVGVKDVAKSEASISDNYPNPFNGLTSLEVNLTKAAPVSISVATITGQQVGNSNYGMQSAGSHNFKIDGSKLSIGVYFYTVTINQQKVTRKMVVM